jgi:2-polyprenyl-3-methyl-5-hydroxy-6-metoxy-1,4-benzoquinol methylase
MSSTQVVGDEGQELLNRYCLTYGLLEGSIAVSQVLQHIKLERKLTTELLSSEPHNRQEVFERCYHELYEKLPWLADTGKDPDTESWLPVLGRRGSHVYEVGSGSGKLARAIALHGFRVEATDISILRGGKRENGEGVFWSNTDGVHLSQFAKTASYDVVISDQVIEHLHPDDVVTHFLEAFKILKEGGKYVFRVPHCYTGPHDISKVFGMNKPCGMHLKEYTNRELLEIVRTVGFHSPKSLLPMPYTRFKQVRPVYVSRIALGYYEALEIGLHRLSYPRRQRVARKLPNGLRPRIFITCSK